MLIMSSHAVDYYLNTSFSSLLFLVMNLQYEF